MGQHPVQRRAAVGGRADEAEPGARRDRELHVQLSGRGYSGEQLLRPDLLELAALGNDLDQCDALERIDAYRRSICLQFQPAFLSRRIDGLIFARQGGIALDATRTGHEYRTGL